MGLNKASITFKGSLQDFIDEAQVVKSFHVNPSVKDMIESCGVPQVEVFGLRANGKEVSLTYNVIDGDELFVYPKSRSEKSFSHQNIRVAAELPDQFIADVHLGKHTRDLRLLGFNTVYSNDADDSEIVDVSVSENRTVLTRDIGLLKHGRLKHGYWLRSTDPDEQLEEVIEYFGLRKKVNPFSRCMACNGILQPVDKKKVLDVLPPLVKENFEDFIQCKNCNKVYWKGSHYKKLVDKINRLQKM